MSHSAGVGTWDPSHANKHSKLDFKPCHIPSNDCTLSYHVDSPLFRFPRTGVHGSLSIYKDSSVDGRNFLEPYFVKYKQKYKQQVEKLRKEFLNG